MYSNELVCKILDYIHGDINKEITIDELSEQLFFNKTYIMKRFKRELGISIHQYINYIKILNSLEYFKFNNSILNIALNNGFNSIEYFSETFSKIMGVSPSIYKKFILRSRSLSVKDELIILENMNKLLFIKKNINNYLSRRKPSRNFINGIFQK